MRVLVTGGAGFIGYHLVTKLLQEGHHVIVVDNMNEYYDLSLKKARLKSFRDKVEFYKIDISDRKELEKVFDSNKIDKICHLAAQVGVRYSIKNPFVYGSSNYIGTLNVLELAKKYAINHIVFASSSSIYGLNENMPFKEDDRVDKPISTYAASKRACELLGFSYSELFKIDFTCLRLFTVYGPFGRPDTAFFKFTKDILEGKMIDVYNNGDMGRDFTFISDIVDGFILALDKPLGFTVINLGSGSSVKLMDFIAELEKELGKKAKINFMPMQSGDVKKTFADISKAKDLLEYEPKVSLEKGIKKFVEWYKEYAK